MDELVINPTDSLVYKKFTSVPFTGFAKMTYTPYLFGPFDPQQKFNEFTYDRLHENSCYQYVGCLSKGSYKKGKKDGLWETFHKTGWLREIEHFKDGKRNGLFEVHYENGKLAYRGNFKDGEQEDGLHEEYYENGQLNFRKILKNGKVVSYEYYNEDGSLNRQLVRE